jgi:hypothetical protein
MDGQIQVNPRGVEAMRIDSSGNLLVGKTASSFTTAGVELAQGGTAGKVQIQRSSNPLALVNLTDDGNILNFYKGTSPVGSIGTYSDDILIGSNNVGVRFIDVGQDRIIPRTTSNGGANGTIDLGDSGSRFKDLYLSGTANISDNIQNAGAAGSASIFNEDGTTADFRVESSGNTHMLFVDGGLNRVGIGKSSPQSTLHIYGDGQNVANLTDSGNTGAMLKLSDSQTTAGSGGAVLFSNTQADNVGALGMAAIKSLLASGAGNTVGNLAFSLRAATTDTNLTERMRLTYGGELIVGGTASQANNAVTMTATGLVYSSRNGDVSGHFNRQTSDGAIVNFSKDGTTVGSIGTNSGNIYLSDGARGIAVDSVNVYPTYSTGGDADNVQDLGKIGARWRDIYLSGSISTNSTGGLSITSDSTNRGILNLSTSTAYQLIGGSYYGYTGYKTGGYHRFFGSDGAEDMRIDTSGNLLVGTTSTAGVATNTTLVLGGIFSTHKSNASVASATTTTIATLPSGDGNYIVSAALLGSSSPAAYNEVAIVGVSGSSSTITTLQNAGALNLSMSGLNLQVYHNQGATQTILFSILRIL